MGDDDSIYSYKCLDDKKWSEEYIKNILLNNEILRITQLEINLAKLFYEIEINDTNYDKRYHLVFEAMSIAGKLGYPTGQRQEDEEWYILYIHLSEHGQISWHMPSNKIKWDGHTTDEKYKRCREFSSSVLKK